MRFFFFSCYQIKVLHNFVLLHTDLFSLEILGLGYLFPTHVGYKFLEGKAPYLRFFGSSHCAIHKIVL